MNSVDVAKKACSTCGETKPLSEFHRNAKAKDGREYSCKPCTNERVKTSHERRRQEMGEDEWRRYRREVVAKSRQKPSVRNRGRQQQKAYSDALSELRERHQKEFDALYQRHLYDAGLTSGY